MIGLIVALSELLTLFSVLDLITKPESETQSECNWNTGNNP